MSDYLGQLLARIEPVGGAIPLPLWAAGAAAAVFAVLCIIAFSRAGRDGVIGGLARIVLVVIGATGAWLALGGPGGRDLGADRRALESRALELATRALAPGSALACLDAIAGDLVEGACEKTLFQTPEATAAAVSYVAAQIALLADSAAYAARDPSYAPALTNLRRAAEADRFGLVAHLLAVRDDCTPDQCRAFALLHDKSRVSANLVAHTYDLYVARHAAVWPAAAPTPPAAFVPPAPAVVPTLAGRTAPANQYIPPASAIPPVNIMSAEPPGPQPPAAEPVAKPAPPARKPTSPAPASQTTPPAPPAASARKPVDLNATAIRGLPPAPVEQ